jgi:hypothetical protein
MTDKTSEGKDRVEVESSESARIDPTALDPEAKSRDQKQLAKATRSFQSGDYKSVRQLVSELTNSSDPQIVQAARDLKRRVGVDPVQIAVIVFCSAVFLAIVITYVLR